MSGPPPGWPVCRHVGNPDTCRECAAERGCPPDCTEHILCFDKRPAPANDQQRPTS